MAQIRINKQKGEIRINLNRRVYPEEAINLAANAFKPIGKIEVRDEVILKPKEKNTDLNEMALAFCDYVLGLVGNKQF